MSSVPKKSRRRYNSAAEWPPWTDDYAVALGPDPEDSAWWAGENGDHHTTDPTPVELLDAEMHDAEADDFADLLALDVAAEAAEHQALADRGRLPL